MSLIEEHFGLHRPPFPQYADGACLLMPQGLKETVERLSFAVERNGIALFTAESGSGKSTTLSAFIRQIDSTTHRVLFSSLTTLGPFSLLSSLVTKLGLRSRRFKGETAHDLVAHLRGLSQRAVIILDEAHRMPDQSLEDLRLLTGDSLDQPSPFALILAGQPLLRERLNDPQHYALAQRITVRARLRPLTETEVALFLDKHLRAVGAKKSLFEPEAVTALFQHSRGLCRLVQNLALASLMAAATGGKKLVDLDCVQQALLGQEAG